MGALIGALIVGGVVGTVGLIDNLIGSKNKRDQIDAEKEYLEKKRANDLELIKLKFEQAKDEANKKADREEEQAELTDKQMDVTENIVSDEFNAALDNMQDEQLKDTYDWNYYAMNAGQSEGGARTAAASSGVRSGSTLDQAIDLQAALNGQQLQLEQDIKRRSYDNQLGLQNANLQSNMLGIQDKRIGADWQRKDAADLRASFAEGGNNWNIYQNNIEGYNTTFNYNIDNLNRERDEYSGWNAFWKSQTAFVSGFGGGFNTGYNIGTTIKEYKSIK